MVMGHQYSSLLNQDLRMFYHHLHHLSLLSIPHKVALLNRFHPCPKLHYDMIIGNIGRYEVLRASLYLLDGGLGLPRVFVGNAYR